MSNQPHANLCGAKTRAGGSCRNRPVLGKKRCRMHGGAEGSGAPLGNQNALKHGFYSREEKANRRLLSLSIRAMDAFAREDQEAAFKFAAQAMALEETLTRERIIKRSNRVIVDAYTVGRNNA